MHTLSIKHVERFATQTNPTTVDIHLELYAGGCHWAKFDTPKYLELGVTRVRIVELGLALRLLLGLVFVCLFARYGCREAAEVGCLNSPFGECVVVGIGFRVGVIIYVRCYHRAYIFICSILNEATDRFGRFHELAHRQHGRNSNIQNFIMQSK